MAVKKAIQEIKFTFSPTARFGLGYHAGDVVGTDVFDKKQLQEIVDAGYAQWIMPDSKETAVAKDQQEQRKNDPGAKAVNLAASRTAAGLPPEQIDVFGVTELSEAEAKAKAEKEAKEKAEAEAKAKAEADAKAETNK